MKCIHYSDGYKYQLRSPYSITLPSLADSERTHAATPWLELHVDGTMNFIPGYAWDGASGPTYDSGSSMRSSLIHDGGYQLIRLGLLNAKFRKTLDEIFLQLCKEDGMWNIRAQLWYQAVRIFAASAAKPSSEPQDKTAGCECSCL